MKIDKIVVLRGPDRIRKRPAVVFGSAGVEGVHRAVEWLLNMFMTGYAKHINVIHSGAQIEISADDQGLYLGQDTGNDQIWQDIFCDFALLSAYAPDENGYNYSLMKTGRQELFGDEAKEPVDVPVKVGAFEMCAIQYASAYMDVTVVRDGSKSVLHFKKGYAQGNMVCQSTEEPSGTRIRLAMDPEVFVETELSSQWLCRTLQSYTMLSPGLRCTYHNVLEDVEESYCNEP